MGQNDGLLGDWRRAAGCEPSGDCVEVRWRPGQPAGVRDSKDGRAVLTFQKNAWSAFVGTIGRG